MRVRLTVPKEHVDADTLNPALEASAAVAEKQIASGAIPPLADAIDDGLRWAPEPSGQGFEGFDLPDECLARGWGDCDDFAPWWAAELRYSGEDPDAKPIVYKSGEKRWHAVVERGDGSIDDPSRWAGMGKPGSRLPTTRPLTLRTPHAIAVKSTLSGAKVRLDVPLVGFGKHIGLALEQVGESAFDALGRGAGGALGLLGFWGAPDVTMAIMHAITHILSGRSEEEFYALHGCTYGDCGQFVSGLAERVGAMKATFDPHMATDIATTIIDPFGLHNLVAPLASDFVKSYATGLSHRGESDDDKPKKAKKIKKADDDETSGDDPCREGWHWEYRGGVNICVPDAKVNGANVGRHRMKTTATWGFNPFAHGVSGARVGARGAGSRGGSGGGRGGGGGSRGGGRGGGGSRDQGGDQGGQQYNQMDYEGGDPFASQYGEYGGGSQYGAPPGFAPQQYSYPYPAPMMQPTYAPPSFYSAPQYAPPQMPPSMANAYYNPYGATLPGTDLAPDPWGGFATPTAFSKYIDKYEQGIRHSAFDDAPLLGERVAQDFTEGEEREWGHQ